jgi:Electron transfer DM13
MKKPMSIAAFVATVSLILSACGGSPPQAAAPVVDAAATKTAMAHDEAMKKDAEATKTAMAHDEAMAKEAEATKAAMAKGDAMKKPTKAEAAKAAMVKAEATKTAMAHDEAMAKEAEATKTAMAKGDAMMVAGGAFVAGVHEGSGKASIDKTADGKLVLRFSNFKVSEGPDLYVHLSGNAKPSTGAEVMGNGDLDLGKLQKAAGDQEYVLPAGFDVAKFKSVVIYCKQFSVVFSTAPLGA